jgi:hypothetical protein
MGLRFVLDVATRKEAEDIMMQAQQIAMNAILDWSFPEPGAEIDDDSPEAEALLHPVYFS